MAIQGCGNVGFHLARELAAAGARLLVADLDPAQVRRTVEATGAVAVDSAEILSLQADILAYFAGRTRLSGTHSSSVLLKPS